jgi:arylamine N-acetyltransferase
MKWAKNMKTMSYSPQKWRLKTWKTWVFSTPLKSCISRYGSWKISREPENTCYSQWNGQKHENCELHPRKWRLKTWKTRVFATPLKSCIVVTLAGNHPGNWKMCAIGHEMAKNKKTVSYSPWKWRHKTWKTRIFVTPLKTCIDMYGSRKSSWEPENMRYSPWNGQKHENCEL